MKNIMAVLLLISCSFNVLADCRDVLGKDIEALTKDFKKESVQYAYLGPIAGVPLLFVSLPLGGAFLGVLGIDLVSTKLQTKDRKKLIAAIDGAYEYIEKGNVNKMLKKMHKKINRKSEVTVSMDTVALAIIDSNENGDLCAKNQRNIRRQSKRIAIELE